MGQNKVANRQAMCDVLVAEGQKNPDLIVLTSDSRGSASLANFAQALPQQLVEVGIAEQDLVSISAGLAHSGKVSFAVSPACFLSMRSIEQVKIDVAYSHTNVKLVGISGGVSYGALGMSHHSLQDFAVTRAIPNLQVYVPADRFETTALFTALAHSKEPAYIRLGRNPVEDCYTEVPQDFQLGKVTRFKVGSQVTLIGIGETVPATLHAAEQLATLGISAEVLNVHSLKPLDVEGILASARKTKNVITIEEHSIYGGLGGAVAEALCGERGIVQKIIAFPDDSLIAGESKELFAYYGLTAENLVLEAQKLLEV